MHRQPEFHVDFPAATARADYLFFGAPTVFVATARQRCPLPGS